MKTEFKFTHHQQEFLIKRSLHLYEKRKDSSYQRDELLDETRYIEIFKRALNNGLTSFRNKDVVTVVVPDQQGKYICILCTLNNRNIIKIITVIAPYKKFWLAFRKCHNRINIIYDRIPENLYKVPYMNKIEKNRKEFDKVCHEAYMTGGDLTFKQVMDFLGIKG
jgi:hypothetical protein